MNGVAALNSAVVRAQFAPGSYVEKQYTVLTATGGLQGKFSGPVNTDLPSSFRTSLSYDANNAYLDLKLGYLTPDGALNPIQQGVAATLENYFDSNGGIPLAFGEMDARGLSMAAGEVATAAPLAGVAAQNRFMDVLVDPFAMGRDCRRDRPGAWLCGRAAARAQLSRCLCGAV